MAGSLNGTVALVTGASSGIGEATALLLAQQGAAVALVARRLDRLTALSAKIGDGGGSALALGADVADEEQARGAVERTVTEFGRLDILVNNAGVALVGPVLDAPVTEWRQMVGINLLGTMYCAQAALPHLLRAAETGPRQVADMVNISSTAGRKAVQGNAVYSATKHAVGAFSEALRQEVTGRHVRISLIEPGRVATELVDHNRPEIRSTILRQSGDAESLQATDIADAVHYVVSRPRGTAVNEMVIRPTEQV
ncbi:SDR family NAD(P)-dependent oxidoreductase [Nocardia transvalensis]|uniref:SDR family NAD(P)-dependent oxidoreductase n=1 Tax=Nocardia transvalensis TaxID=37333 RepID=UPI0018957C4E|nr:SDR family NAD(P)-dependent oxidoreductase [Nocardia transvalensis]MBF6332133.1 SDR family NAD(P)-dependent oxidoreductase [Nocardia transvalensis]